MRPWALFIISHRIWMRPTPSAIITRKLRAKTSQFNTWLSKTTKSQMFIPGTIKSKNSMPRWTRQSRTASSIRTNWFTPKLRSWPQNTGFTLLAKPMVKTTSQALRSNPTSSVTWKQPINIWLILLTPSNNTSWSKITISRSHWIYTKINSTMNTTKNVCSKLWQTASWKIDQI